LTILVLFIFNIPLYKRGMQYIFAVERGRGKKRSWLLEGGMVSCLPPSDFAGWMRGSGEMRRKEAGGWSRQGRRKRPLSRAVIYNEYTAG
jgi:hypothetical protein